MNHHLSRRAAVKSTVFGLLAASIPNISFAKTIQGFTESKPELPLRYPSIDDSIVNEVVGKSHFDLETVKKLVDKRPELARATWDWGFGDWESAIGAASHVGRRDIVGYLMSKGARPTLFTYAMLGCYDVVKEVIESLPNSQTTMGPHGISLLSHAKAGLRMKDTLGAEEILNSERLIDYLQKLGNSDSSKYLEMTEDKSMYLGDYMYGEGETDGFSIKLNMRDNIALGKLGKFGGALHKVEDNKFIYNGITSVFITFQFQNNKVVSLTVTEPDLVLVAKKVN
ncbi:hypothetical protein [Winogradskyella sp.]|uniref:hypothetical protein n=1 Tax=Winogradskyella sp. TaxID=1883156 RepID=UPI003703AD52